jgi:gas vesicle protein
MFSRVRIAIRFFFVGLAVGVLLAPRKGEETRRQLRAKADQLINDILDAATLGTANTGGPIEPDEEADAPARRATRSTNGTRTRAKTASVEGEASASTAGA